jgi:hypothetical protein
MTLFVQLIPPIKKTEISSRPNVQYLYVHTDPGDQATFPFLEGKKADGRS